MNGIFEFIEKPYSLRINSQFKPEDPKDKIWHRNRKIWHRIFFPNECKAINFIKKRNQQVFSCEICESSKSTYFEEHL